VRHSTLDSTLREGNGGNVNAAAEVGKLIAARAKEKRDFSGCI
jgi:hypothetical protein